MHKSKNLFILPATYQVNLMRIFLLICILSFIQCSSRKMRQSCGHLATVVDLTGLDGCGLLFELENGKKILPVNAKSYELQVGQKVSISYQEIVDRTSTCMAEDMMVQITCYQPLYLLPEKKKCADINDPMAEPWMKRLLESIKPIIIEKYDYLDGFAYLLKKPEMHYLYDCQGTLLCSFDPKYADECRRKLNNLKNKTEIWIQHR